MSLYTMIHVWDTMLYILLYACWSWRKIKPLTVMIDIVLCMPKLMKYHATTILLMQTYRIDSVLHGRPCRFHWNYPELHRSLVDRDDLIHFHSARVGWLEYLCFQSRLLFDPTLDNGFDRERHWVLDFLSNIAWSARRASVHWLRWYMTHRKLSTCIPYQALSCSFKSDPHILNTLTFVVISISFFRKQRCDNAGPDDAVAG